MQARHICSANNLKVLFVLLVTAALSLTPIDASASKATAILELIEKLTGKSLRNLSDESGAGGRQAGLHEASRQAAYDEDEETTDLYDRYPNFYAGLAAYDSGDYEAAIYEWELSAAAGHIGANYNLGVMYSDGLGVPQDYAAAQAYYLAAAERGHADAEFALGEMYLTGRIMSSDWEEREKKGAKWIQRAAEQGHAEAQLFLATLHIAGAGVDKNYKLALFYLQESASQGVAAAQAFLATEHIKGEHVTQDYVVAHMWFNVAAANGYEEAREKRDLLVGLMTPEQIAEAQRLARECVKKEYKNC